VFIASDVNPTTGVDTGGTHEIYTAKIGEQDTIETIQWTPLTAGSPHRNIRPLVVAGEGYKLVLWLSGPWNTYLDYDVDVLGLVLETPQ
jgi:hypothetical protein